MHLAERNEQVLATVREKLGKYPTLNSRQLYDMAIRLDPALEQEGLRTFHARYVLPIRRARAAAEGRPRKPRKRAQAAPETPAVPPPAHSPSPGKRPARRAPRQRDVTGAERDRVRDVLLRFAREVAAAETRAELVSAVSGVDTFVDEVLRPPPLADAAQNERQPAAPPEP